MPTGSRWCWAPTRWRDPRVRLGGQEVQLPLPGRHQALNAEFAWAVAQAVGIGAGGRGEGAGDGDGAGRPE